MRKITVVAVGRIREKYLLDGIDEYRKRISRYCSLSVREVASHPDGRDSGIQGKQLKAEAENIRRCLPPHAETVALCVDGERPDSVKLARKIGGWSESSPVAFIIGGSNGLDRTLLETVRHRLSLSPCTFPHQLFRLLFLEQLYRSFAILNGERYHK